MAARAGVNRLVFANLHQVSMSQRQPKGETIEALTDTLTSAPTKEHTELTRCALLLQNTSKEFDRN